MARSTYNDGKRGFQGWDIETERKLLTFVDVLNRKGKLFMISHVMEHKGKFNKILDSWVKNAKYEIINIEPIVGNNRKEILITNFKENVQQHATLHNKEQIPEEV